MVQRPFCARKTTGHRRGVSVLQVIPGHAPGTTGMGERALEGAGTARGPPGQHPTETPGNAHWCFIALVGSFRSPNLVRWRLRLRGACGSGQRPEVAQAQARCSKRPGAAHAWGLPCLTAPLPSPESRHGHTSRTYASPATSAVTTTAGQKAGRGKKLE